MPREIKTKISVDGEAAFKKSLKSINSELNVLSSELGAVTSGFEKGETSMKQLKAVGAVLEKQLEQQKIKVAALNGAVSDSKAIYDKACKSYEEAVKLHGEESKEAENAAKAVDKAQSSMDSYTIQLNKAQKSLNETEKAFEANRKAAKDLSNLKLSDLMPEKVANNIEKAASAAGKLATNAGKAAVELGKAGANTVNGAFEASTKALTAYATAAATAATATVALGKKAVEVGSNFEQSMSQVAATMGITVEEINNGSADFEKLENAAKEAGATTQYSASQAAEALNYLALAGYSAEEAATALPNVLNLAAAGNMELAAASDLATDACSALGLGVDDLDTLMDKMARASQKSNMSVAQVGEAMLVCAGVSTSFGMDLDELNTNLGILANNGIKSAEGGTHLRNIMLSLSTPTDTAASSLKSLGVATVNADGSFRDLNDIMQDLDSSLSVLGDDEKTALLSGIFNKTDLAAVNALLKGSGKEYENLFNEISKAEGAAADMADTMLNNLQGSVTILKSSLEGVGIQIYDSVEAPLKETVDDVQKLVSGFSKALGSGGKEAALDYINKTIPEIGRKISEGFSEILPTFLDGFNSIIATSANSIVDTLPNAISTILPSFINGLKGLVLQLTDLLPELLPLVTETGAELFTGLIGGLNEVIEKLNPMLPGIVEDVGENIIKNAPLILETGVTLLANLIDGIASALPELVEQAADLVPVMVDGLVGNLGLIIQAGVNLIVALAGALPEGIPAVLEAVPQIIEALFNAFGEVDWEETSVQVLSGLGDGIVSLFSGALGIVDSLLGTNLQKWYDDVTAFWRDAGAKLYEVLNADKIDEIEMQNKYGGLDDDIIQYSNELMRGGMSSSEALAKAKEKFLDDSEKMYYYNQNFADILTEAEAAARYEILKDTGQITGVIASAERGAAMSASSITNNSTTTNNNSTKNITIVNNSPTALSPYEQTKKNEQQLKAAKLYG